MSSVRKFVGDKLKEDISSQIRNGQLKPGDAILSGPQLSRKYKISKMSVEKTIREMVDEDILYRISGKGTFVKEAERAPTVGIVANPEAKNIFTSYYHSHLYEGIEQGVNEESGILSYQKKDKKSLRQMFENTQLVDGMIIINPEQKLEAELIELANDRIPFIVIGNSFSNPNINFIDSDNAEDSANGVEHLIKSGYERIVFISSLPNTLTSQKRLEGYLQALKKNHIKEKFIYSLKNDFEEKDLMDLLADKKPTALFLAYCVSWAYLRNLVKRKKITTPANMPVLVYADSVDSSDGAAFIGIKQPLEKIGYLAARNLLELIRNKSASKFKINLNSELVLGNSF